MTDAEMQAIIDHLNTSPTELESRFIAEFAEAFPCGVFSEDGVFSGEKRNNILLACLVSMADHKGVFVPTADGIRRMVAQEEALWYSGVPLSRWRLAAMRPQPRTLL